jgi:predicted ATPase
MGKSSLVNELQVPAAQQNGYFISGRYVQAQSEVPYVPYSALIEALRSLIQLLLAESEEGLAAWRSQIQQAVHENGQVIVSIIPEAALVLGTQPPLQELSADEEQNRFNLTLQNFIETFMSVDHPLILFLDNLQWIDAASVSFLQHFMRSPHLHHMMLVGAYRAGVTSIILNIPETVQDSGGRVTEIKLMPLQWSDVQDLLFKSLNCSQAESTELAEVTLAKTGGNPFFINEFLRGIYDDHLLRFDMGHGGWAWELPQIRRRPLMDNVVDVMSGKIRDLPEDTQQILQLAACIGYEFDLSLLATLSSLTRPETASVLWHSLASGLIFPLTGNYILAEQAGAELEFVILFTHGYPARHLRSFLKQKRSVHWRIGQYLLEEIPEEQREGRIFELVNHLNLGAGQIQTNKQRLLLAELNLLAAQKSFFSAAHDTSYKYSQAGLSLLKALEQEGLQIWQDHYQLAFQLHLRAGTASYLIKRYDEMESLCDVLLAHVSSVYDQASAYEVKLSAYLSKGDRPESLKTG